jgi:hypothetical protein
MFKSIKNRIPGFILSIIGGVFIILTRFSRQTGLDPDNALGLQDWWGKRHYVLLIVGIFLLPSGIYVTSNTILPPLIFAINWFIKKNPRVPYLCKMFVLYLYKMPVQYLRKILNIGQVNSLRYSLNTKPFLIWLLSILPVILLTLHFTGIFVLGWKSIRLTRIELHDENEKKYVGSIPGIDADTRILEGAPAYLEEDGKILSRAVSIAKTRVRENFIAPDYQLIEQAYFTPDDETDPSTNGRSYTVKYPVMPPFYVIDFLIVIAFLSSMLFSIRYRFNLYDYIKAPPLYLPIIILTVVFALNRLWLLIDFPIAGIHPDSETYFAVSEIFGTGVWPLFNIRSIGYPLILKVVFTVSNKVMSLVLFQNLLSCTAGLTVVIVTYRWRHSLGLLATLSMIAFFSSVTPMRYDTAMLSEGPYTSFMVLSFALLVHAFSQRGWWISFASASFFMAACLLTRPNGMYLFVTFLMVVVYMFWNKYSSRLIVAFIAPFVLMVTSMCVYNYITINVFSVTAWGEGNLAVATFTFWEKDESYPQDVNDSIDKIKNIIADKFKVTGIDPARINDSWDHQYLSSIFLQGFNIHALKVSMMLGAKSDDEVNQVKDRSSQNFQKGLYSGKYYDGVSRQWIRKISLDSIKKHPYIYLKFVVTMLRNYYTMPREDHFTDYLYNRIKLIYLDHNFSAQKGVEEMVKIGKEFADSPPPKNVILKENVDPKSPLSDQIRLIQTPLLHAYSVTYYLKRLLFTSQLWIIGFFIVMVASFAKLVASLFRDNAAFVMFLLTISNFGASLVVSLVEYSQPRYSYPMEWVYYYSVLVGVPLLLHGNRTIAVFRSQLYKQSTEWLKWAHIR